MARTDMKTVLPFLVVGCGGFVGSVLRYSLSLLDQRYSATFPQGTLWSNLGGCLILGAVSALAAKTGALSPTLRLLLATGLCGGFTTMSTFTYELFKFLEDAEYLYALGYFLLTFLGCMASFCLGYFMVTFMTKG
jgi:CrcB protein